MKSYDFLQFCGALFIALGFALIWYPLGFIALGVLIFVTGILMEKGGVHGSIESNREQRVKGD